MHLPMAVGQQDTLLEHVDVIDVLDVDDMASSQSEQEVVLRYPLGDGSLHLAETEGHHHVCARVGVDVRVMVVGLEVEYMWEIHQVHLAIDSEEQFVGHLRLWFLSALGFWRQ